MDTFKAVTWNVYYGTKVAQLEPHLEKQLEKKVSILLMQEAGSDDIEKMLEKKGLKTFNNGQYRIAWNPKIWPHLFSKRGIELSKTTYYSGTLGRDVVSECAEVILCDREGRTCTFLCYHTPSSVQGQNNIEKRVQVTKEAFTKIGKLARDSETDGFLAGGDDNWDEDTGPHNQQMFVQRYMLGRATGMRQLQAGRPTFGSREIDDFRIPEKGRLVPVERPWVDDGGGDEKPNHKIHGREFGWKNSL